jgi:thioredoxin 1
LGNSFFYFKELFMSAKVVTVSDAEFDQTVLKSDKPVMLDFWAEWCQPCKMLTPTVEELAGEYEDQILVGKLNVDDNPNTATTYGIRGIPTLLFIKGGQVVQQVVGVKSKAEIKKVIEENLLA